MDTRIEILNKNHEERLNDIVFVLNSSSLLPGSKVLDEWRFHLEFTIKESGWIAVYKPSVLRQPKPGPDFVNEVVMVEKVLYQNFEAYVVGMEPQNNDAASSETSSSLSSKMFCVQLEDLYPCVKQPSPDLDGVEINNVIDKLRFFKQNLWLPWDEEDDHEDWRVSALEPRMQLLYDMDQGQVSCELAERVRRLFSQAWRAHDAVRVLEEAMEDEECGHEDSGSTHESEIQQEAEDVVIRTMQLHHRIDNIKKEMERLENPLIRNLMAKEKQRILSRACKPGEPWVRFVWNGGPLSDFNCLLQEAAASSDTAKERFKIYPLLQLALEESATGDTVLLAPGTYSLYGSAGLENGGVIKGLGKDEVSMSGCEAGDVMLSVSGDPVVLASTSKESEPCFTLCNVTLDAKNLEICLLLNSGHVLLENCKVKGFGVHEIESIGILVREGSKLTARNCSFNGFWSGLVVHKGAIIELQDCVIESCEIGVQLYRGVYADFERCTISECAKSGVLYRDEGGTPQDNQVPQDLLNSLPGVTVQDTSLQKVEVVLNRSTSSEESFTAGPTSEPMHV